MRTKHSFSVHRRSLTTRLRGYFIAGVLVTAPITITAWLTITIIDFIDTRVKNLILPEYLQDDYSPLSIPGLGLIIVLVFILFVGMLTTNFLGRFFVKIGERILDRLPVVRSLYGATKQIFETVFASQSDAFREVVMIEYPRKDMWVLGFLTGTTRGEVQAKTSTDVVNIFVPTTPNPTSGFLLFVPKKDVITLDMSVEQGLKLVVSAGIVTPDKMDALQKEKKKPTKPRTTKK